MIKIIVWDDKLQQFVEATVEEVKAIADLINKLNNDAIDSNKETK